MSIIGVIMACKDEDEAIRKLRELLAAADSRKYVDPMADDPCYRACQSTYEKA